MPPATLIAGGFLLKDMLDNNGLSPCAFPASVGIPSNLFEHLPIRFTISSKRLDLSEDFLSNSIVAAVDATSQSLFHVPELSGFAFVQNDAVVSCKP